MLDYILIYILIHFVCSCFGFLILRQYCIFIRMWDWIEKLMAFSLGFLLGPLFLIFILILMFSDYINKKFRNS